jgi:hypothetical protein
MTVIFFIDYDDAGDNKVLYTGSMTNANAVATWLLQRDKTYKIGYKINTEPVRPSDPFGELKKDSGSIIVRFTIPKEVTTPTSEELFTKFLKWSKPTGTFLFGSESKNKTPTQASSGGTPARRTFSVITNKAGLHWIVMAQARARQDELQEAHRQRRPINEAYAAKCFKAGFARLSCHYSTGQAKKLLKEYLEEKTL